MTSEPRQVRETHRWHRLLADWIREWTCFIDSTVKDTAGCRPDPCGSEVRMGPPPRVGHIRLMMPFIPAAFDQPLTVAVLQAADFGHHLVAPFSPLSIPASPGELELEREPPLSVISLEMGTVVSAPLLTRSRWVDDLTPVEQAELEAVYEAAVTGARSTPLPLSRLGPPLWHPRDPRHDYFQWQARRMDALLEAEAVPSVQPGWEEAFRGRARAAEARATYQVGDLLAIRETPWRLRLYAEGNDGQRRVEWERSLCRGVSVPLNGGWLVSSKDQRSPPFIDGVTHLSRQFEGPPVRLVLPTGEVHEVADTSESND